MLLPFFLVDVFAEAPLTGNPLALVPDADGLQEAVMHAVAREFNQSETTFLLQPTRDGATWRLRSFTPAGAEVFGVGHNALGAWWWLATAGKLELNDGGGLFTQEIGARVLPVEVVGANDGRPSTIWMEQAPPQFGQTTKNLPELAAALELNADDISQEAQVVSTGAAHLLVPVSDRGSSTALDRTRPDSRQRFASWALRVATSTPSTRSSQTPQHMHVSSTRPWASGKTLQQGVPPDLSPAIWWHKESS